MDTEDTFLLHKDRFGGISIDTNKINYTTDAAFEVKLKASIAKWKHDHVRGLSIKIAKKHSSLIPICVQEGFEFHHAQPGYVMMTRWLPTDEENMLPEYANQYLGCAGFVVNDQDQVLLIKEKYHSPGYQQWKLPGGHANTGEEIAEAARREVLEETGVDSTFTAVLTFRHQHNYRHGLSDFYFVCLMQAQSVDINACNREISDCCWMDVDDYINDPNISDANRFVAEKYKEYRSSSGTGCLKPFPVLSYNKKTKHLIYSVHPADGASSTNHLKDIQE